MQQRDADGEVGAEPVHDRGGQRDLRDEEQRGALGREAGGDRLDVDRRLAAARDALEERRRRVAPLDRLADDREGGGLGVGELRTGRPGAAEACGPAGQRPPRSLADLGPEEAPPDEPGDRR